jgi:hypothetical protein
MPPARTAVTIEVSARRVGAWAWLEGCLYEVVGSWVGSAVAPAAKVYFDAASQHHAWRAQLWRERLPARLATDPAVDLARPPTPGAEAAMKTLAGLEGDASRLAAYGRVVLARLVVGYRDGLAHCSAAADRPVARVLGIAVADVLGDWQEGARLLVEVVEGPDGGQALEDAARSALEVEQALIARPGGPSA